ncbi:MAG: PilZ domain-containing protein [Lachnospiraceae bacterium]|nr:PilZ domain-containing protein [Lachnospiraceae bacterium]
MANEVIQAGNKIEMHMVEKRPGGTGFTETDCYVSRFLRWLEKNTALIVVPTLKGQLAPMEVDDSYELCFFARDGMYQCRAKVVRRWKDANHLELAEVSLISALEKYQRRRYYRMSCSMPMSYSVVSEEQKELLKQKESCQLELKNATVLDISGGGMRFHSSVRLELGELLFLEPEFPENVKEKVPYLFGRVVSSQKAADRNPPVFDSRVEFTDLHHSVQEQIVIYIFKEERDRRKRENY